MIRRALAVAAILTLAPLTAAADEVDDIHTLTNQERAAHGLAPLQRLDCLDNAAQQWSARMATDQRIYHSDLKSFMATCGLSAAAENVLGGEGTKSSPQQAVDLWMGSAGHRANILNPDLNVMGVGYSKDGEYATQMFGYTTRVVNRPDRATNPDRSPATSRGLANTGADR